MSEVLIFETHPIQYRAPVFQALARTNFNDFEVVFASDFSVRGYTDQGFGANVAWDIPLTEGYRHRVLGNDREGGINKWRGLSRDGVSKIIADSKPAAIMLHSLSYEFCLSAYWNAIRQGIPIWLRTETQDHAFSRGRAKAIARGLVYRSLYRGVDLFFAIGEANRQHYLTHGVDPNQIRNCHYCTRDPVAGFTSEEKETERQRLRRELSIDETQVVVGFCGKLIPKKDPRILLEAWTHLAPDLRERITFVFVGSGEMLPELQREARAKSIHAIFPGFINQSSLWSYYLAFDVMVLPSRKMGETWGLVVNEALHTGCAVVTSDAVGSSRDFETLDRFRVFNEGDSSDLAESLGELLRLPRNFDWAASEMERYSIEAAAQSLANEIQRLDMPM